MNLIYPIEDLSDRNIILFDFVQIRNGGMEGDYFQNDPILIPFPYKKMNDEDDRLVDEDDYFVNDDDDDYDDDFSMSTSSKT